MSETWALLGSGEFEPWTDDLDRGLLSRPGVRRGRVLILPTASAAEGDEVFDRWGRKGLDHYARLGIDATVVPLKTRDDAGHEDVIQMLDGAAMAYFSGGNPAYLAAVLRDTPFWSALRGHMERGLAYAGCSAGVASLGDVAPDSARIAVDDDLWASGLRVFRRTWFAPHWDTLDGFVPGLTGFMESSIPPGSRLIGIDEDTAMVGDGARWSVTGAGSVHVYDGGGWVRHRPGEAFTLVPPTEDPGRA